MTSQRKITANRRNSRNSCGPRTAAGKARASRNAQRHGLASITHRLPVPSGETERLARAICGDDEDPALFAQGISIAENELALRAIRERQVECVERLREITAEPFAVGDNGIELSKAIFRRALLAREQILRLVPFFLEKYKDQVDTQANKNPPSPFDIVPLELKVLMQSPETIEEEERALELARQQIKERDEFEAFEQAAIDLIRLDRYERRAWSRQKHTIRAFMNLKLVRDTKKRGLAQRHSPASNQGHRGC
jgi:hypothetical protein